MYPLTRDNFKSILNIFTIAIWWLLFVQIQHRALWDSKLPGSRVSTAQGVLRKLEFLSPVSGPVCVCVCVCVCVEGGVKTVTFIHQLTARSAEELMAHTILPPLPLCLREHGADKEASLSDSRGIEMWTPCFYHGEQPLSFLNWMQFFWCRVGFSQTCQPKLIQGSFSSEELW